MLIVVVAALSLPFLILLVRRPVLRRLALRNARRRPREAALVLLGSLLGTAIITGSFIVGDTLEASIRRSAFTQLGPVDEVVQTSGLEAGAALAAVVSQAGGRAVDGVLPMVRLDAAVATPGPRRRAEPQAQVLEVDFGAARRFGGDPAATGIEGPTPAAGAAAVGRDLARTLGVDEGDRIEIFAYGTSRNFVVDRVLPRLGVAGYHLGLGSESPNVFVAPGTVSSLGRAAPAGAVPPTALVLVSNAGGVIDGAAGTARVAERIEGALGDIPAAVRPAKQDLLRDADEAGKNFTELFGSIGFFSVLAGVLLLVNIFVMLSDERKTELGMLRAVGLRRSGAVGAFSLEGWMYALLSSAIGTVAGLGVGRVIVLVAAGIFAGDGGPSLELRYDASLSSVQTGFVVGFVMSLVTIVLTSARVARLNVIRAIRDLPDPAVTRQRPLAVVLGAVALGIGGVVTVSGIAGSEPHAALAGPALVGVGLVPLLRRLAGRRRVVSSVSATVLAWAVACFDLAPAAFRNPEITVFVVDGVVLTGAAVALASQNQDVLGRALRGLAGRLRRRRGQEEALSVRLGLAYPLARRFRTGMILTMYALVVFTLAAITLFSDVFAGQVDDFTAEVAGGADLRVVSNPANPVPPDALAAVPGVRAVAVLSTVEGDFEVVGSTGARRTGDTADEGFQPWPVAGFDEDYLALGPSALEEFPARYETEADAYRAVLADPNLVIVDEFFLQEGGGPPESPLGLGSEIVLRDPRSGRTRLLRVGALAESSFDASFALMSREGLRSVAGDQVVPNLLRVATEPGVDAQELADSINGRFLANGADAVSFRKAVEDGLQAQNQFFRLMQGYLALGLVVGIAGLGVVMVRAVRERRRQIGLLRALGFGTADVRRAFLVESGFVALEGILIGVALAMLSTWRLLTSGSFGEGLEFTVPWLQLGLLVVLSFGASLLATLAPAQQASRIRPAVALRIAD